VTLKLLMMSSFLKHGTIFLILNTLREEIFAGRNFFAVGRLTKILRELNFAVKGQNRKNRKN